MIIAGQPFEEYRKVEAMNATTLLWGLHSMSHLKAAIDGKLDNESPALTFGRAFHVRVLEPELYASRVAVSGSCAAILKSGANKGNACGAAGKYRVGSEWYCGTHGNGGDDLSGLDVISQGEHEAIEAMRASVIAHPIINQIRRRGGFETTAIGEVAGVKCKARFDKLIVGNRPVILDLKKTTQGHAAKDQVQRTIEKYHYHIRAALYLDVLAAAGGPTNPPFILVFVEDSFPYAVSVCRINEQWLRIGHIEYRRLLREYSACLKSGHWPGYLDEQGNVDVWESYPPPWLEKRYEHQMEPAAVEQSEPIEADQTPIFY
jgi:hypothetical protein